MAELRSVDPRILQPHPNPARRTPAAPGLDEQLFASIKAIGIIQPPIVVESDGTLVINAGHRRVTQAIRADFAAIDVLVCDADEALELMRALA
jgi:ParB-like chromosome segregation protein Spo0J